MGESFFESIANSDVDTPCKSVEVALQIRAVAAAYTAAAQGRPDAHNGKRAARSSGGAPPEQFIPTLAGLRSALSLDVIRELLDCRCKQLCEPPAKFFAVGQDEGLAELIYNKVKWSENKLRAVAILVLSGTLFALRDYHHSPFDSLDGFAVALESENAARSSDHSAGHSGDVGRRRHKLFRAYYQDDILWRGHDLASITDIFTKSIRAKFWLFRVPTFEQTNAELFYEQDTQKVNLPFVNELTIIPPMGNREYLGFRILKEYAHGPLQDKPSLFRKVHKWKPGEKALEQRARTEVKMLKLTQALKCENIAEMLFSFEERDEFENRISIVFEYHEHTLQNILEHGSRGSTSTFGNAGADVDQQNILRHPLWKAVLGIVGAVQLLHDLEHPDHAPKKDEVVYAGHYDIKPTNVLLQVGASGNIRLMLTDFEHASVHRYDPYEQSGHKGGPTTHEYSPPEMQIRTGDDVAPLRRRSYDIWSLGCLLLEVLLHLKSPTGYSDFRRERSSGDSSAQEQGAVFWTRSHLGQYELHEAVDEHLQELEHSPQVGVSQTADCIRRMLSTAHGSRPKISQCVKDLRDISPPSRDDWLPEDVRGIMTTRLSQLDTYCLPPRAIEETRCRIYMWRQGDCIHDSRLLMAIERDAPDRWVADTRHKDECIAPKAFFCNDASGEKDLHYAFGNLLKNTVVRFKNIGDYLNFFTLFTYQRILNSSINVHFSSCEAIEPKKVFSRPETHHWKSGTVQIWNSYEEEKFKGQFEGAGEGVNYTPVAQPTNNAPLSQASAADSARIRRPSKDDPRPDTRRCRFKLALFTHVAAQDWSRPMCMVFKLDTDNIVVVHPGDTQNRLQFRKRGHHDGFPVAVYEPSLSVRSMSDQTSIAKKYPAIPCSPEIVNNDIDHCKGGFRLASLDITFDEAAERDRILNQIIDLNIMGSKRL